MPTEASFSAISCCPLSLAAIFRNDGIPELACGTLRSGWAKTVLADHEDNVLEDASSVGSIESVLPIADTGSQGLVLVLPDYAGVDDEDRVADAIDEELGMVGHVWDWTSIAGSRDESIKVAVQRTKAFQAGHVLALELRAWRERNPLAAIHVLAGGVGTTVLIHCLRSARGVGAGHSTGRVLQELRVRIWRTFDQSIARIRFGIAWSAAFSTPTA